MREDPRVDLNKARNDGLTPAYIAAQQGCVKVLKELARHPGVDLNKATHHGGTPVYVAACQGHMEVINFLLDLGVDTQIPFYSSAEKLKAFASKAGAEVLLRMKEFLENKPGDRVVTRASDIAYIMGHAQVVQGLKVHQSIERFKALLIPLKQKIEQRLKKYPNAHQEALTVVRDLEQAARVFYTSAQTVGDRRIFQVECSRVFEPKKTVHLNRHREFFGAFFAFIKQFFATLKSRLFCKDKPSLRFFDRRTDSAKIVDELEGAIVYTSSRA